MCDNAKPRKTQRLSPVVWTNMAMGKNGAAASGTVMVGETAAEDKGGGPGKNSKALIPAMWLSLWLVNNIGITMLNKAAFSRVGFPYPLVTSAFHMSCNWLGTVVYFVVSGNQRQEVKGKQWIPLVVFSVVFSLNIVIGNFSAMLVSVKFNQVMRSLVPAIVMVMGISMFGKTFSFLRKVAVVPIMGGVALACYGEMEISLVSFVVTCFCVMLAALKVVLSGEMLTGNMKMPPLHLLSRMAPLALMQMVIGAVMMGEVERVIDQWEEIRKGYALWVVLATGLGSFSLNLVSLQANKVTSPLTLSIMANVKQVLLIVIDIFCGTSVSVLNVVGIVVVIIASSLYSMLSISENNRAKNPATSEDRGALLPK